MIRRAFQLRPAFFAGFGALTAALATQFGSAPGVGSRGDLGRAPRIGQAPAVREIAGVRVGARGAVAFDELARLPMPGEVRGLAFNKNFAYAAMTFNGLATLDLTDPTSPRLANHLPGLRDENDLGGRVTLSTMVIDDGARLMVCDRRRGLGIYDLANPARPEAGWTLELPGELNDRAVSALRVGDQYYLACGGAGLRVLPADFAAGTAAPRALRNPDYTHHSVFYPPHWLLVSDGFETGMRVLDLKDPDHPKLAHTFQTGTYCDDIIPVGHYVVLGIKAFGTMIVDMKNPAKPVLANTTREFTRAEIRSLVLWRDRYLIASTRARFVDIYDMADPTRPVVLARLETPAPITDMTLRGDLLYAGYAGANELGVYRLRELEATAGG